MGPALAKPRIGITLGDPSGIGPEVTLKALCSPRVRRACRPVVVGSLDVIQRAISEFSLPMRIRRLKTGIQLEVSSGPPVMIVADAGESVLGKSPRVIARYTIRCIVQGARLALSGMIDALTTAPVSKESLIKCGFDFSGHTEFLASISHSKNPTMMFVTPGLNVSLVTTHLPLSDAPGAITRGRVASTILNTHDAMKKFFGIRNPKIGVSGLNPHSGEGGVMGSEEKSAIIPGIKAAAAKGVKVSGPFSGDAIFKMALDGEFDAVVAMFHDQALPVIKTLFPKKCVNVTLGLPFVRTSPGHGTARDIAWKGKADESGMIEAILFAAGSGLHSSHKRG